MIAGPLLPHIVRTQFKCPILSCDIVYPVQNITCGHVLSACGVVLLINQVHGAKYKVVKDISLGMMPMSPVSGCANEFHVGMLQEDADAERRMRTERISSSGGRDEDGVEDMVGK